MSLHSYKANGVEVIVEEMENRRRAEIRTTEGSKRLCQVDQDTNLRDGSWEPATVNWSAWGSTNATWTDVFIEGLKIARDIADGWNREKGTL